MANKIDFDNSPAFRCFKQFIKSSLKQIGLEINTNEKQKIIVGYGKDNDNDVIENDWFLPNQDCFVFVVPNIDEVRFEQEEYVYSEVPSFLFIGRDFRIKFYDAESLGWNKDENGKPKRIYVDVDEIYVVKCSKCGKITLVESIGAWYCRNCEYQDGDADLIGNITDFSPIFDPNFRKNRVIQMPNKGEYEYVDEYYYEKPKTQKEDYDEYINSDEWKEKREAIFELKGKRCSICGTSFGIIDCHHLNYDHFKHEEENEYDDVIPLCRDCHAELHNFMKENDNVIKQLKSDLERLKDSFRMKYMYAIADTVYNRTKDLFQGIQYNRSVVMPYLDTIYGKSKCRKDIRPCFNSETLCKKLEKNGNLATQEGR
jgi:hypothetical protein